MYSPGLNLVNRHLAHRRIMVTTESTRRPYVTIARNGLVTMQLDAPVAKGAVSKPDATTSRFNYLLQLEGQLTPAQKAELHEVARTCLVKQTLSRRIEFQSRDEP
jgi:hypothetical protein